MGDASNVSFSEKEKFETLIELIEYYVRYTNNLIQYNDEDSDRLPED